MENRIVLFCIAHQSALLILHCGSIRHELDKLFMFVHALINNYTTSPSFLRADSQRGAAELTIARRKRGRVI